MCAMKLIRSSPHPDSARHLLQIRVYEDGARVVLVEWERPRKGGNVVGEVESGLLPLPLARTLCLKARYAALEAVPELLRAASPRPSSQSTTEDGAKVVDVTLSPVGLDALAWLVRWLNENGQQGAGQSAALDLAVQEAAKTRGW
jgi:hypothetical protein